MKKRSFLGLVIGLLSMHFISYTVDMQEQEKELTERVEMLRGERPYYGQAIRKGAAYGALAGSLIGAGGAATGEISSQDSYMAGISGIATGSKRAEKAGAVAGMGLLGAGGGALVGAMWSAPVAASLRWWQVRKISNALKNHTGLNFKTMPKEQAMLLVAAYRHNIPMMKVLINRQPDFVHQNGVWQALTELFYNQKPTFIRLKQLQQMIQES